MIRTIPLLGMVAGLLACSEPAKPPLHRGHLNIVTFMTGFDADSDGFRIRLDGVVIATFTMNDTILRHGISVDTIVVDSIVRPGLSVGDHTIELEQLAANCAPSGPNPLTVHVGADSLTTVEFGVRCVATRAGIWIRFLPTGAQRDTNGYMVLLDGVALGVLRYDGDTLFRVPPGPHELRLRDVAPFCLPVADSVRAETLTVGEYYWSVVWQVHCLRPLSERIAYNSQSYIWTMRSDGSDPQRWALPGCFCTGAAISRDGMRVAWWQQGIVWMYADSTGFKQLSGREANDVRPAWSPDGRRLAYVEWSYPDTADIFVINADGTGRQRITYDSTYISDLAWSPDGSKIAYSGKGNRANFLYQIWVMNADGSGRVQVNHSGEHQMAPAWSPDGLKIAYSSRGNAGHITDIFVMNADGSGATQLTTIGGWEPSWSPDGHRIVFRSFRDGPSEIYVMNADGTGVSKLIVNAVPGTQDAYPFWGP